MRKLTAILLLLLSVILTACAGNDSKQATTNTYVPEPATQAVTEKADEAFDPYAGENRYDIADSYFEKQSGVDYGTVEHDVTYYSTVAGDDKMCNILLPAGYDKAKTYPVMYVVHGFGGSHDSQIDDDSYLTLLYGNMLRDNLTVPMILVNLDMYTDKLADKDDKSDEELRYIYDKVIDEITTDLMPFIEANYPVSTERRYTAVAGMSEGGAKSLCIGFEHLDRFGYIGSFAPDTGVKNRTDLVEGYEHNPTFWRQCFYNFLTKVFHQ